MNINHSKLNGGISRREMFQGMGSLVVSLPVLASAAASEAIQTGAPAPVGLLPELLSADYASASGRHFGSQVIHHGEQAGFQVTPISQDKASPGYQRPGNLGNPTVSALLKKAAVSLRTYAGIAFLTSMIFAAPASAAAESAQFPSGMWDRDVFYQIMPIAYADANGDGCGDFAGMKEAIPYLRWLGVTALWITPVFEANTYHGYFSTDFRHMRESFGGDAAFFDFMRAAHRAGIRVLIDIEVKIMDSGQKGRNTMANSGPPYNLDFAGAPSIWTEYFGHKMHDYYLAGNANTIRSIQDILIYWLAPGGDRDAGVDGYRIDSLAPRDKFEVEGFYREVHDRMVKIKPWAFLLAEQADWGAGGDLYLSQGVDSTFSFPFYIDGVKAMVNGNAAGIKKSIISCYNAEAQGKTHNMFFENHDTSRSMGKFGKNQGLAKAAAALLFSLRGIPTIYYGQEIGMLGHKDEKLDSDGSDIPIREPMDWQATRFQKGRTVTWGTHSLYLPGYADYPGRKNYWQSGRSVSLDNDGISVEEEIGREDSLLTVYKKLIGFRKDHPAFSGTGLKWTGVDGPVLSYVRYCPEESILVAVNFSSKVMTTRVDLSEFAPPDGPAVDLLTGRVTGRFSAENSSVFEVLLEPYQYVFIRLKKG